MIRLREITPEVYYAEDRIITAGPQELQFLRERALRNERARVRICTHRDPSDALHEMLICFSSRGYIRPHRHLNKVESYHFMEGRVRFVAFDDEGNIRDCFAAGAGDDLPRYLKITDRTYHTFLIDTQTVVYQETTQGPFNPALTEYAAWSPDDADPEGVARYMKELRESVRSL